MQTRERKGNHALPHNSLIENRIINVRQQENTAMGMNPNIKTIEIGTRTLKEKKVYPLSIADQLNTADMIVDVMSEFSNFDVAADADVVLAGVELIKNNIHKIIDFVAEEPGDIPLSDVTNEQLAELAGIIFEVNFEAAMGKFKALSERVKSLFPQTKLSVSSSGHTQEQSPSAPAPGSPTETEE